MPAPETDPTAATEVHLPVLPTGREEALRRQMQEQPPPPSSATLEAAPTPSADATPTAPETATPAAAGPDEDRAFQKKLLEGKVIAAIQQIYDPEIPVNIHELGLIYKVDVHDDNSVWVEMTLTAPACPVAGTLPGQVEAKIEEIPEVTSANVELVWDPPWSRDLMSEAAQLQLGLM